MSTNSSKEKDNQKTVKELAAQTVPKELYEDLLRRLDAATLEVDTYRAKSPLVGIRWYGEGGFGIGLSYPIAGITKISLNGVGDKAVIDFASWVRLRKNLHSQYGLLVRDDKVIKELHVLGVAATPDVEPASPNSFTPDECAHLLTKATSAQFKKAVEAMDSHWGPIRILRDAAVMSPKPDATRVALLRARSEYLQCEFGWGLLHPHDLRLACERYKVRGWEDLSDHEMVETLTDLEMALLNEDRNV